MDKKERKILREIDWIFLHLVENDSVAIVIAIIGNFLLGYISNCNSSVNNIHGNDQNLFMDGIFTNRFLWMPH